MSDTREHPETPIESGQQDSDGWVRRHFGQGVWKDRDFVRLWVGQTTSQLGSQVTLVASPLVAIVYLHVGPSQMGLLGALGRLPFLLYIVAGVFVDRSQRRPVVIRTDLLRGLLLLTIPLAAAFGVLSFWLLATVTVVVMALTVWFDIAYMSYVPGLVQRGNLMQANTIMESSRSGAQVVGPSVGGVLVQVLNAPTALVLDAASYFASGFAVWRIRAPEVVAAEEPSSAATGGPADGPAPTPRLGARLRSVGGSIHEGLAFVGGHRILRPLAVAIGINNLAWAAELTLYVLFMRRGLGLSPALIGITLAATGPGALLGSMLAGRTARRFGLSGAIIGGLGLFAGSALLIPFAPHAPAAGVPVLMLAAVGMAAGGQICAVNVLTTRQTITPDRLLGRVNASFRFVALGVSPLGSLLGGLLGTTLGLRQGLLIAICGMFAAPIIVLLSPVRRVRTMADASDETPPDTDAAAARDEASAG